MLNDDASEIKAIGIASRQDDGRKALDVLDRVNEPKELLILKGIECLAAYRDYFTRMSIEDAKAVLAANNAGVRVLAWAWQPAVKEQIEANHPDNEYVCVSHPQYIALIRPSEPF